MRSDQYQNQKENIEAADTTGTTAASANSGKKKSQKRRGSAARTFAYRVIILCLLGIIGVSGYNIYKKVSAYMLLRNTYKEVAVTAHVDPDQFTGVVDFEELLKINSEVQGWLYQEGTIINYPVVRGTDNETYLHTLIDGTWADGGTLFVDYRNQPGFQDFNTIIYGHHMRDGSMFRSLRGYTKEDGYYQDHKQLELITPTAKYHLQVFAAYITPADSELSYKYYFESDEEKELFLDQTFASSLIQTDFTRADLSAEDTIITLSTCAYDFDEARYVVLTKAVPWTEEEIAAGNKLQMQIDEQEK